jgi:hypothetical protein
MPRRLRLLRPDALQSLPDINIICEKLAIAGVTRFEDRFRLPLGISINMTSYAAKLLVLTMYDPERGIRLVAGFGKIIDLTVIDSSALCAEGAPPLAACRCLAAESFLLQPVGWYSAAVTG